MTILTRAEVEALLLCPFCGCEGEIIRAVGETWVKCRGCNATSQGCSRHEAGIAAWNRRAPQTAPATCKDGLQAQTAPDVDAIVQRLAGEHHPLFQDSLRDELQALWTAARASAKAERKPHLTMTPEEYAAMKINGWHEICRDIDGFGGVGIRYLGVNPGAKYD